MVWLSLTSPSYYKESHKILGNTFGMCVLQDFEAITPNLLARTIETVQGGGLVVLLLKTMTSLKQLYSIAMVRLLLVISFFSLIRFKDVHSRYRTSSHESVVARFNERFILSLGSCDDCLVLDDELNVLPISKGKDITALDDSDKGKATSESIELKEIKDSFETKKPLCDLVKLAKTTDQVISIPILQ